MDKRIAQTASAIKAVYFVLVPAMVVFLYYFPVKPMMPPSQAQSLKLMFYLFILMGAADLIIIGVMAAYRLNQVRNGRAGGADLFGGLVILGSAPSTALILAVVLRLMGASPGTALVLVVIGLVGFAQFHVMSLGFVAAAQPNNGTPKLE